MESLLPFNASPLEKALEAVIAKRLDSLPIPIATLWNPNACPEHLLPWLAWSLSIETWDSDWPESVKRGVIQASIGRHRIKGTPASLRQVLDAVAIDVAIEEWFQYGGEPYTFRLTWSAVDHWFSGLPIPDNHQLTTLYSLVDSVKPVRSLYTTRIKIDAEKTIGFANQASAFTVLKATLSLSLRFTNSLKLAALASAPTTLLTQTLTLANPQSLSVLKPLVVSAGSGATLQSQVMASMILTGNQIHTAFTVSPQMRGQVTHQLNVHVTL